MLESAHLGQLQSILPKSLPTSAEQKDKPEVEARFGSFDYQREFRSEVTFGHYYRLRAHMEKLFPTAKQVMTRVDAYGRGYRIITQGTKKTYQRKALLRNINLLDYGVRIAASTESELTASDENFRGGVKTTRERTRTTYALSSAQSLLDGVIKGPRPLLALEMTEILMGRENYTNTYEVELEFYGQEEEISVFVQAIEAIYLLLRGSRLLYKLPEVTELNDSLYGRFRNSTRPYIDASILVAPRNVQMRDIVYGGLVGNQATQGSKGTTYAVSPKADGVRKMLVFFQNKVWSIYPPHEYNLLADFTPAEIRESPELQSVFASSVSKDKKTTLSGSMFDAEEISADGQYYILLIDTLLFRGTDARSSHYERRRQCIANFNLQLPALRVEVKKSYPVPTPEAFFRHVRTLLAEKADYQIDGLIFTPVDCVYNPESDKLPLSKRCVTTVPDVLKWKDPSMITIDFFIRRSREKGRVTLYSYDKKGGADKKGGMVEFTSTRPLFDPVTMVGDSLLTHGKEGTIIEYRWDDNVQQLLPFRVRGQRRVPNSLEIARANWNDIQKPVHRADICGDTLALAYRYHNRIKSILYSWLPVGSNILDIGSGRGGDVDKWKRLASPSGGKVIAVEPDQSNRSELISRVQQNGLRDSVTVLAAEGEDTQLITSTVSKHIPGGKVDAIVLMLSLSFFWKSSSNLDSLCATIKANLKVGGALLFLTVDGTSVLELFEPALHPERKRNHLTLATSSWSLHPPSPVLTSGRAVDIFIPGIVGEQREYLVMLNDLDLRLRAAGIVRERIHQATEEPLLGPDSLVYSSLYSYGAYRRGSAPHAPSATVTLSTIYGQLFETPTVEKLTGQPSVPLLPPPTLRRNRRYFDLLPPGTVGQLACTWVRYLLRIGTEKDGDSLLRAILTACYAEYQKTTSPVPEIHDPKATPAEQGKKTTERAKKEKERIEKQKTILNKARVSLAAQLSSQGEWERTNRGIFPLLTMQEIIDPTQVGKWGIDFTLQGLLAMLKSRHPLAEESYDLISRTFDVDLFIVTPQGSDNVIDDIDLHATTAVLSVPRQSIVLLRTESNPEEESKDDRTMHYEVLAIQTEQGPQTLFPREHPLINKLLTIFLDPREENDPTVLALRAPLSTVVDIDDQYTTAMVKALRSAKIGKNNLAEFFQRVKNIFAKSLLGTLIGSEDPAITIFTYNYRAIRGQLD